MITIIQTGNLIIFFHGPTLETFNRIDYLVCNNGVCDSLIV